MIYRAIAYILGSLNDTEQVVFVESTTSDAAHTRMRIVLCTAWCLPFPAIDFYNLFDEIELLNGAFGAAETGDARLLEIGWSDGQPRYAEPERSLFLVSPRALRRLVAAQQLAARLQEAATRAAA